MTPGKVGGLVRQHAHPQVLLDACRQDVEAAEHQVDVGASGRLHRLQLARQFGGRGLGEGELDIGILGLVALDGVLQQRQGAADVDHVDCHVLCVREAGQRT